MATRKPAPTQPQLPPGEAPLDTATLDSFLRSMGTEMVLVGGQALAFWMNRYGIEAHGAAISNDGDVLGKIDRARLIAKEMRAALIEPDHRALTSLVAQMRVPVGRQGLVRNIDVLHLLYTVSGLRKSAEFTAAVWRDSVEIEWKPGHRIRVMHPLHVLDSRVQNAVGLLDDKGPHVLTQAGWAIEMARAAIVRVLNQADEDTRLGAMLKQVHGLAGSRAGRQLLREHGLEVLHAVPIAEIRRKSPQQEPQLRAIERLAAKRASPSQQD
ncbi:hypothetical protein [Aquabacterium sp.]|uniref:hypothetical protein n=1 Tax=Aquabacterium sp. TaxID=1872578 RepID=UPI002BD234A8|nr:hypothetical protein [Aquabacterium sp.]HSW04737.1 hypothetical protein [Aquabacterium sp.]